MSKKSRISKQQEIDLSKEYDNYINYLLDDYGKKKYIEDEDGNEKGYKYFKKSIACMAHKCKEDINKYLESDILASREGESKCKSPFDYKCFRKIRTKHKQHDKLAKVIHCKTNKCITKKQMLDSTQAYLDHDRKQICISKNCDKAVSDYRVREILAYNEIEWQCNKDNLTANKQFMCTRQKNNKWYRLKFKPEGYLENQENQDNQLRKLTDKCYHTHCTKRLE